MVLRLAEKGTHEKGNCTFTSLCTGLNVVEYRVVNPLISEEATVVGYVDDVASIVVTTDLEDAVLHSSRAVSAVEV